MNHLVVNAFADELEKIARVGFLTRPSAGKMGRAALLGLGVGGAGLTAAGVESTGRLTGEAQGRVDQAERQLSEMSGRATRERHALAALKEQALAGAGVAGDETQGAMDRLRSQGLGGLFSRETLDEGRRAAAGFQQAVRAEVGIPYQTRRSVESDEALQAAMRAGMTARAARLDPALYSLPIDRSEE